MITKEQLEKIRPTKTVVKILSKSVWYSKKMSIEELVNKWFGRKPYGVVLKVYEKNEKIEIMVDCVMFAPQDLEIVEL